MASFHRRHQESVLVPVTPEWSATRYLPPCPRFNCLTPLLSACYKNGPCAHPYASLDCVKPAVARERSLFAAARGNTPVQSLEAACSKSGQPSIRRPEEYTP